MVKVMIVVIFNNYCVLGSIPNTISVNHIKHVSQNVITAKHTHTHTDTSLLVGNISSDSSGMLEIMVDNNNKFSWAHMPR